MKRVTRPPSGILFGLILGLSLALAVWWTVFQAWATGELKEAGAQLTAGDLDGVAQAFGAEDGEGVVELGRTRLKMFASEGTVFLIVLSIAGGLYWASVRREAALRAMQDRFLAGATHELKTPLATISLLLESLRDDRLPPEKRDRYLQMGLLEADRLERGLTNVLVAAGLRTASAASRRSKGNLTEDIRRVVQALALRASAAEITIEVRADDEVVVDRDPEAMQLILHNLLDNAIKYSSQGGSVTVELDADERQACISVHDQGRGMDNEELSHAFEAFWRGSESSTGGSGLGLHLVRELTTAHDGQVSARSRGRGEGTTVTLTLPREGGRR